jgi:hypothetical protein
MHTLPPKQGLPAQDELKFTKNAVVLVIKGAQADLTLIDLPGIIQSDEDSPQNVGLVKDMVTDYIKRERAIIVAAISCKDDINNQVRLMPLASQAHTALHNRHVNSYQPSSACASVQGSRATSADLVPLTLIGSLCHNPGDSSNVCL